jgi:hypothetical protein
MARQTKRQTLTCLLTLMLIPAMIGAGCTLEPPALTTPSAPPQPSPTPHPEAMVTFRVHLPETLPAGDSLYLAVLDEVTGLALNQTTFIMEAEGATDYYVILPFAMNSVLKYRYIRQGSIMALEHLSDGRPVRYRLYQVDGPGLVQDVVSRWTDTQFSGQTGRINGTVVDMEDGSPIPSILISAGGAQALTAADGSFILEGLPPGTHNLAAYALDGAYRTYQQGATVASDSSTPAPLRLQKADNVRITFNVSVPAGTIKAVPMRLAGSLIQFGNTFSDLAGGISALSSRLPQMTIGQDGRYSITLELPVGADFRYKYTLGDGLWNTERTTSGAFQLRQLIVPENDAVVEDHIEAWSAGRAAPITFDVEVPVNTPREDIVSIQFNPGFGWTESIPMWKVAEHRWIFVLYSPIDPLGSLSYRYCRNDLCGSADDRITAGFQSGGRITSGGLTAETMDDRVDSWVWLEDLEGAITLPNLDIQPRSESFLTGIEFQPLYHPSWQPRMNLAVNDIKGMNAGWLVLTPTWAYTRLDPPVLEPVAGPDPLWEDTLNTIEMGRAQGLNLAIFPTPRFPGQATNWWRQAQRDFPFWSAWFESYRIFLLHHAGLAAASGAEALIVGGDWLAPALPNGLLADGTPSGVPEDAEQRWRVLLEEIRTQYEGHLLWALPHSDDLEQLPPFLDLVDEVYLLWSAQLGREGTTDAALTAEAGRLLDEAAEIIVEQEGKTIVLGVSYPSAAGWQAGCLSPALGECLPLEALARPNPDIPEVHLDLHGQVQSYNAILAAVNEKEWVTGFVSRGYYPPAVLHDKSVSVHGKPARGVLWYWFPQMTGSPE